MSRVEFWDWVAMNAGETHNPGCELCGNPHAFFFQDWNKWLCGICADNEPEDTMLISYDEGDD